MRGLVAKALLGIAPVLLAACGLTSDHPLSDEATSVVDARLKGRWELSSEGEGHGKQLLVGGHPTEARLLEAVGLDLDPEGRVRVQRLRVYGTTLAGRRWLSLRGIEADSPYLLAAYEIEDGVLTLYGLDEEVAVQAIDAGELAGGSEDTDDEDGRRSIRLRASTAALRSWIEAQGARCLDREKPLVLRRIADD